MRIAGTEFGVGAVVFATLLALIAFAVALAFGFDRSASYVDALDQKSQRQLVANYLDRRAQESIAQQKVQIVWDDAYKAVVSGQDSHWADVYLGDFLWSTFHYDHLFVVDAEGRLIREWRAGKPVMREEFPEFANAIRKSIARAADAAKSDDEAVSRRRLVGGQWPFDARGKPVVAWSSDMIRHNGIPTILTVASILPDDEYGLMDRSAPGYLVVAEGMNSTFLAEMGEALLLPDIALTEDPDMAEGRNGLAVRGSDGAHLGSVTWRAPTRSSVIRADLMPLGVAFACFLVAILAGGAVIVRALLAALRDVRAREAQSQHLALHDAMTGLPNRCQFQQKLDMATDRLAAEPDLVLSVAYFDIDNFKFVNDTLGHAFGDGLVEQVARRGRQMLKPGDLLARFGGDEFVVLRVARRDQPAVSGLGEDVLALFAEPFKVDGRRIDVTASCGICWAPDRGRSGDELLRNADIALYAAKAQGRARWRAYQPQMKEAVHRRHNLETDLRRAIGSDQLSVVYQPIVRTADGRIDGLEALLRWHHSEQGDISPSTFIPIAEQSGLMRSLGKWMLHRALSERAAWPECNLSLNLSPTQLVEKGFPEELRDLVRRYNVDPSGITFEVTEGILMERGDGVFEVLARLKAMGFGIALDDFGTGYSSLSYLRMFRFDRIKIDKSFVQNIEKDFDAQSILKAIAALGRSLRTRIVAEGVETPLQRQLVAAAGCDLIQGFLFWKPMAAAQVRELLVGQADPIPIKSARRRKAG